MRKIAKESLKAFSVSLALLGSTSVLVTLISPDAAFAGKGKDKKSPGKGKSNGNSTNKASLNASKGKSNFKSDGAHPSQLGALNAANASATARENAAPNSRVGLIAAYEAEVEQTNVILTDLIAANDALAGLEVPRPIVDIEADIMTKQT